MRVSSVSCEVVENNSLDSTADYAEELSRIYLLGLLGGSELSLSLAV